MYTLLCKNPPAVHPSATHWLPPEEECVVRNAEKVRLEPLLEGAGSFQGRLRQATGRRALRGAKQIMTNVREGRGVWLLVGEGMESEQF